MERSPARQPESEAAAVVTPGQPGGIGSLLSDRNFRYLWLAGSVSGTIRWLETLAVALFVLDETNSGFLVALMLFFRMFPMFLFGAFTGVIADRINRRLLMMSGMLVLSSTALALAILALTGNIQIWHAALGVFISGTVWSSEFSVRRTMMGEVAGMERVGVAMGLDSATVNATRMLGPVLGGTLYEFLGLEGVYLVGAVLYLAAWVFAVLVKYTPSASPLSAGSFLTNLGGGIRYVRDRRLIVGILAVTILVNIWGFPYTSMVPVIGEEDLHLNGVLVGLLVSAEGLGALIAALFIATHARIHHYTRIYVSGSFLFLVTILAFAFSPWFALSLPVVFLGGIGIAGFATMQSTLVMMSAPPELRSRVMGVLAVSIGTGPLGILHIGALEAWLGARTAVAVIGMEGIVALAIALVVWPELRRSTDVRPPDLRD